MAKSKTSTKLSRLKIALLASVLLNVALILAPFIVIRTNYLNYSALNYLREKACTEKGDLDYAAFNVNKEDVDEDGRKFGAIAICSKGIHRDRHGNFYIKNSELK